MDRGQSPQPRMHDHLFISIKTFTKVISYLNPLVLLVLLISLNLTYFNVIRLLFVQTMTSLTLTPGSRSAAKAVGHVIFYWLVTD